MMYTKIASVIAGIVLLVGILSLLTGSFIATSDMTEVEAVRYLGNKTTGQMIDRGIYTIIFAVALGVLTEISKSLFNQSSSAIENQQIKD